MWPAICLPEQDIAGGRAHEHGPRPERGGGELEVPGDERSEARDRCLGATTYTWSATTPPPSHLWLRVVATSSLLLLLPARVLQRLEREVLGLVQVVRGGLGVGFFGRCNAAVKTVWTPGGR